MREAILGSFMTSNPKDWREEREYVRVRFFSKWSFAKTIFTATPMGKLFLKMDPKLGVRGTGPRSVARP
jgi:hypothetical protein